MSKCQQRAQCRPREPGWDRCNKCTPFTATRCQGGPAGVNVKQQTRPGIIASTRSINRQTGICCNGGRSCRAALTSFLQSVLLMGTRITWPTFRRAELAHGCGGFQIESKVVVRMLMVCKRLVMKQATECATRPPSHEAAVCVRYSCNGGGVKNMLVYGFIRFVPPAGTCRFPVGSVPCSHSGVAQLPHITLTPCPCLDNLTCKAMATVVRLASERLCCSVARVCPAPPPSLYTVARTMSRPTRKAFNCLSGPYGGVGRRSQPPAAVGRPGGASDIPKVHCLIRRLRLTPPRHACFFLHAWADHAVPGCHGACICVLSMTSRPAVFRNFADSAFRSLHEVRRLSIGPVHVCGLVMGRSPVPSRHPPKAA
jgi:hypothetical protein